MDIRATSCCGLKEIAGLSTHQTAEEAMRAFLREVSDRLYDHAFILFTGVDKAEYLTGFVDLIRSAKLGALVGARARRNPNSGNLIRAYIWAPNLEAIRKWQRGAKRGRK